MSWETDLRNENARDDFERGQRRRQAEVGNRLHLLTLMGRRFDREPPPFGNRERVMQAYASMARRAVRAGR